jgi:arylsulfatase A-like enzyme
MTYKERRRAGRLFFFSILWLGSCGETEPPSPEAFFFVDHVSKSTTTFERGDLRSLRDEDALSAPVTLKADTRICLAPPLASRLDFTVDLPSHPVLRFGIASATSSRPGNRSPVVFRLLLRDGDRQKTVFREVVPFRLRNRWLNREVELDSPAGSQVRLTFEAKLLNPGEETSGDSGEFFPLWANPVLTSRRDDNNASNIILVSIDCLRSDHVGVYGYERDTTPHLDRFAEDGVVFETAIGTAGSTHPTHMSIFTGLLPSFHGATPLRELSRSVPYLSELLGEASYQSDALVTGAYLSQHFGFNRGFHTYRRINRSPAAETVDVALDVMQRAEGQNHFMFLHLIDAHWPYEPPPEFLERFGTGTPDVPRLLGKVANQEPPDGPEDLEQLVGLYDGEIAYADRELGRFFDELKAIGVYDRALIIVTADHGEAFYEHGRWQHTITLYEEIIRIPLIVKWPENSEIGRVKVPVSQVSIFPTILEEADVDLGPVQAVGLGRFVSGGEAEAELGAVVSECVTKSTPESGAIKMVSLRNDRFKYIATFRTAPESNLIIDEMIDEELYDLTRDPGEKHNLWKDPLVETEPYRQQLQAYLGEAREFEKGRKGEGVVFDEKILEQLKSLGYVDPR